MIIWRRKNEEKQMEKGHSTLFKHNGNIYRRMIPVQASEYWSQAPETASPCVMVMEMNTGAVLYEKNVDEVHYPASITKIMTTLIAIEKGKMDDIVTFFSGCGIQKRGRHLTYFKRFRREDDFRAVSLRRHARICK